MVVVEVTKVFTAQKNVMITFLERIATKDAIQLVETVTNHQVNANTVVIQDGQGVSARKNVPLDIMEGSAAAFVDTVLITRHVIILLEFVNRDASPDIKGKFAQKPVMVECMVQIAV